MTSTIDETDWKLPIATQATLNATVFELRNYIENVQDVWSTLYPDGVPDEDKDGLVIELWLEDLNKMVDDIETLEYAAPFKR